MTASQGIDRLLEEYKGWYRDSTVHEVEGVISVDEVIARVASFYEKIRGIVDWREEHLLRKTAIERILKRRMMIQKFDEDFAEHFLSELVRGGHFPNKRITFAKVDEIQTILEKYVFLFGESQNKKIEDWLFSIAAVEVEEVLSAPKRERALIELMTNDLAEKLEIKERKRQKVYLAQEERVLQIFIAVQRALLKLDNATITFHVLERFYPDWNKPSQETLQYVGANIARLQDNIQNILEHPYAERFYQVAEKYDTPYLIVHDIISADPEKFSTLLENPQMLEDEIRHAYNRRHSRLRKRLKRAAFYSTLSIFITKVLLALSIEIPFEKFINGDLNFIPIGLSIAVPPMLMLILVGTVKTTSKENFDRVTVEVMKIIMKRLEKDVYLMAPPKERGGGTLGLVYGFYTLSFLISFGLAVWVLTQLNFSIFSILIFLMFVSLVLFAGTKIRQRAGELLVEPEQGTFFYNILDIFSLPMIQVGRWLSGQISRYNVIVFALNFLIEAPFQIFVEFLDQWRNFLKEKKEEIH